MNRYLAPNDVLHNLDSDNKSRIIWINSSYKHCATINLTIDTINTEIRSLRDIEDQFTNGELILAKDDYQKISLDIDDKYRSVMEKRYKIVEQVVSKRNIPDIFVRSKRRKILQKVASDNGISENTLRKYLKLYWRRGLDKYALLPDWDNIGIHRKKDASEYEKFGKPSDRELYGDGVKGVNVGRREVEHIKTSIHYYNSHKKITKKDAYDWMLWNFYKTDELADDGETKKLKTPGHIPTYNTYLNWFNKIVNNHKSFIEKYGEKEYELNQSALLSDSNHEVFGPGSRYQIDSTIGDVHLVSSIDGKKIVGRLTIFLAIDVFSRMIVGLHVGLDVASWDMASALIYNCYENKVDYCKKYGIEINHEDWPVIGIPEIILADRGEMVWKNATGAIEDLGIDIEHTPSYRADGKGIVEKMFDTLNQKSLKTLPGAIESDYRKRGERDYREQAALTVNQITKIIIETILSKNKSALVDYPLTRAMLKDNVPPIPLEIWKWGMGKRTGNLNKADEVKMITALLRKERGSITREGLKFRGRLYVPDSEKDLYLFAEAKIKGRRKVEVLFDPRGMNQIFIFDKETKTLESYTLNTRKTSNDAFLQDEGDGLGVSLLELEDFRRKTKANEHVYEELNNQNKYELSQRVSEILQGSDETRKEKKSTKNIRENRNNEKEILNKGNLLVDKLGEILTEEDEIEHLDSEINREELSEDDIYRNITDEMVDGWREQRDVNKKGI